MLINLFIAFPHLVSHPLENREDGKKNQPLHHLNTMSLRIYMQEHTERIGKGMACGAMHY